MKVVFYAYRNWAVNIVNNVECENKYLINNSDYEILNNINPNLIFFLGWSKIVPDEVIEKFTCICLHPSPLPKYRGGSPIQNQILNRELNSAVSFFIMDKGLDTGDIIYQKYLSLEGKLDKIFNDIESISIEIINQILTDYKQNNLKRYSQDESESSTFKRRKPEESEITVSEILNTEPKDLYNKVRALNYPYPNAFIKCKDGKKLFLIDTKYEE